MALDDIIKLIQAPVNFVREKLGMATGAESEALGKVQNAKQAVLDYKNVANEAKNAGQQVNAVKDRAVAAGGQAKAIAGQAQAKKKKMGLFSKKKVCESCGQKLEPSWDQCPYCGAGGAQAVEPAAAAPAPTPSPKARTMAIDTGAAAAGPISSNVGWLVPLDGPQVGELFQLKGRCTVGKAADCDVVLNDPSISSRHAEFLAGRAGFRVNDLGSTNGTYVNDKRVTSQDLVDNDNVRLGRTNFKFKSMN
jgi:pSer/pThr/pTyr-binding forkhead associated (FHA) protein